MAHLNVREHRIEAKIAYVGPKATDIATTFDRLRAESSFTDAPSDTEAAVALDWRPARSERFRDHDIFVRVLAPRSDRFDDVLRAADGVVFVGDPDAKEKNAAYLAALRAQLLRVERTNVPLLVQDQELTTLESALGEVLATMDSRTTNGAATKEDREAAHPLLTALRQVLRDTVREHVDEIGARLESRIVRRLEAKLDTSFADISVRLSALEAKTGDDALVLHVIQTLEETDTRLREIGVAVATTASHEDVTQLNANVGSRIDRIRDELKSELVRTSELRTRSDREYLSTATQALRTSFEGVRTSVASDVRALDAIRALESKSASQSAELDKRLTELIEELKKPKKSWFT